MSILYKILLVLGFCLATVGAAGFHETIQNGAIAMFAGGIALMFVGWFQGRRMAPSAEEAEGAKDVGLEGQSKELIGVIYAKVVALDEQKSELSSDEIRKRIDDLLAGEYFDLTSRNEELAKLIGFNTYAKVWEGIASAERQLARVWSLATDGFLEEGLESLPLARKNLERAAQAAAEI